MSEYHDEFFDEDRPWSKLKNRILGSYMVPYLGKVNTRPERILLVDLFAGPGKTGDGDAGSPLLMCSAAEKRAKGKYSALFVNKKVEHHKQLTDILYAGGYQPSAETIIGDAIDQLRRLTESIGDETLFLYIDPFGLDVEFDGLLPLLNRDKRFSTEILINLHMPIIHRLAARNAPHVSPHIKRTREKLTRSLGGEYWKEALLENDSKDTKDREKLLVQLYRNKLASTGYLTFTGACPVREKIESQTKYYMVFASPHPHSILLLNDTMHNSFHNYMHVQWAKDTLFADSSWIEWRNRETMRDVAIHYIREYAGDTRKQLWQRIVMDNFMLFSESEFIAAINSLYKDGQILCIIPIKKGTLRPTRRLNEHCVFKLAKQQTLL